MAEDQSVNADRWTREAKAILENLGWVSSIADLNIDVPGEDGQMHGIDGLFSYSDGYTDREEGVFFEAKSYLTTSFNPKKISDWVYTLDKKIRNLRNSPDFHEQFPQIKKTHPRNGLLAIWFRDAEKFINIRQALSQARQDAQVLRGRGLSNRLFVISNDEILRLTSLIDAINSWKESNKTHSDSFSFIYPSLSNSYHPMRTMPILNLELLNSSFVLARGIEQKDKYGSEDVLIVFYFGRLDQPSFKILHTCLLRLNLYESGKQLYIYHYQRDDENFRKIKPAVEGLFSEMQGSFKYMNAPQDVPAWVKNAGAKQ